MMRSVPKFFVALAFGLVILVYFWFGSTKPEKSIIRFHAAGNEMFGRDLSVRQDMDSFAVSAFVAIRKNRAGWTRLTPDIARAICGGLLTLATAPSQKLVERDAVYRVEFTINDTGFLSDRDIEKDNTIPVRVRDGQCIVSTEADVQRLAMPAPLQQWTITEGDIDVKTNMPSIVFDIENGNNYQAALDTFAPNVACNVVLKEIRNGMLRFPELDDFDHLTVSVRNKRGSNLFYISTGRSWTFDVVGDVCVSGKEVDG